MQFTSGLSFERKMLPVVIARSPAALIMLSLPVPIIEYGGGVLTVDANRRHNTVHQMLAVGHGVEAGREYWLMMNSWGTDWGEAGHVKIEKRFSARYTKDGAGVLAVDVDGALDVKIYENQLNRRQVVGLLVERNNQASSRGGREGQRIRGRERRRGFWGCFSCAI